VTATVSGSAARYAASAPRVHSLIEFAHAVDFSRETFDDDRTLVAVWPRRKAPAPTAPNAAPNAMSGWPQPGAPGDPGGGW
jgi:hypothetical protein